MISIDIKDHITSDTTAEFKFSCRTCHKKILVETYDSFPLFIKDFITLISKVGWVGAIDFQHNMLLIFCSNECRDVEKKLIDKM